MRIDKKNKTSIFFILAMIFMFPLSKSYAQGYITGPTSVIVNTTHSYELIGADPSEYSNGFWNVPASATIQSQSSSMVSVNWQSTGNYAVFFIVNGSPVYTLNVTVSNVGVPLPSPISVNNTGCGTVTLQRTHNPPNDGTIYHWQGKSHNGTSTTKGSGPTFVASEGSGTYYLRAYKSGQWSNSSTSIYITIPPVPSEPTGLDPDPKYCSSSFNLIANPGTNGDGIHWYETASGGIPLTPNANGSLTTGVLNSTKSYYAESYNTSTGCKSSTRKEIKAEILTGDLTIWASSEPVNNTCGSNTIVLSAGSSNFPGGSTNIEHRWYDLQEGGNYILGTSVGAAAYVTQVTVTGQSKDYWVSAYSNGCETGRVKISAVFDNGNTPNVVLTHQNGIDEKCGTSATFNLVANGGSTGSIYKWYANETGGLPLEESNIFSPTVTSSGETTFWVGGTLKNNLGCDFPITNRVQITVTLNPVPSEPTGLDPDPKYCSSSFNLIANPGTNGDGIHWYETASGGIPLTPNANGSLTTGVLNSTKSYYAESYNTSTGCKSSTRKEIKAEILTGDLTIWASSEPVNNTCGSNTIVLSAGSSNFPGGSTNIEHRWYDLQEGGNYILGTSVGAAAYVTQVTVTGQSKDYWVSAYSNGCETNRVPVSAVFLDESMPSLTLSNEIGEQQCGSEINLTLRATGGANGSIYKWYATGYDNQELYTGSDFDTTVMYSDSENGQITFYVGGTLMNSSGCSFSIFPRKEITITLQEFVEADTKWYPDTDGDGWGDIYSSPVISCTAPNDDPNITYVLNDSDVCPELYWAGDSHGCPPDQLPENYNTVTTTTYDINGIKKAASKSYFDELGKGIQTQSWDVKENSIWATETRYDEQGRPALQTLSAPIRSGAEFEFMTDFIKRSNGSPFDLSDFSGSNTENPNSVGNQESSLGWYYSDSNTNEALQDITSRPYSRTIYSKLNPGSALRSVGGNKIDTDEDGQIEENDDSYAQTYTFSMKASQELSQAVAFAGETDYDDRKIVKTVSRDVHGIENVIFTDTDGKTLAAARSGSDGSETVPMQLPIPEQGYVDIHIPEGITGFTVSNNTAVTIYNLITEETEDSPSNTLANGFYRVAINDVDNYSPGSISVSYSVNYYDYSLNEYDLAGRLIKSYQPLGNTKATKPSSTYTYNTLGQLIHTSSPDEGEAWFKYREDGQIRFSQNSKQQDPNEDNNTSDAEFSYTNYDDLGRPVESGVVISNQFSGIDADTENPTGTKKEQTFTVYDALDATDIQNLPNGYKNPTFLSGNVAKTQNNQSTTYYSYDVYGRVKWVVQDINGLSTGLKTMDYEYHPITGAVTQVIYQKDTANEFFAHRYTYDADNLSLIKVETSTNGTNYRPHANYEYYETGGLKRTEIVDANNNTIQGMDYVYNLAGQLKSINHPSLQSNDDPGGDTDDVFGMQLDYYTGDYTRTNTNNIGGATYTIADQFNGNIKGVRWKNTAVPGQTDELMYAYTYDRNNWLRSADFDGNGTLDNGNIDLDVLSEDIIDNGATQTLEATSSITLSPKDGTNGFHARAGSDFTARIVSGTTGGVIADGDYDVSGLDYDANGNILSLKRNKGSDNNGNTMDDLSYTYKNGTNQLLRVQDAENAVAGADDIDTQTDVENYVYNSIGQLVTNKSENLTYIYNTSGLVTEVLKSGNTAVKFYYNDRGQRVKKERYVGSSLLVETTYYVRDSAGSVMAIYTDNVLKEQPIYGSGRIGVAYNGTNNARAYVYELTDHLGNVRAVVAENATTTSGTDYYPFGMPMPARNVQGDYRYTYQGQEKDAETGMEAFELRLWDSRIGRWLTTDPAGQYNSPYLGMGNNPISRVDPDGGFDWYVNNATGELEWHNTSASIDGLTWVGTNSASYGHLNMMGELFGGSGRVPIQHEANRIWTQSSDGYQDGVIGFLDDTESFLKNPVNKTIEGTASFVNNTGLLFDDFIATGDGNLGMFFANKAYNEIASMSAYDWGYTAGYNSPGIVLSAAGGYALSTVRIGSIGLSIPSRASIWNLHTSPWVRIHPSYSRAGSFNTSKSLTIGSNPYNRNMKISNPILWEINEKMRNFKFPGNSWRVQDRGHFHIKR